MAGNTWWEVRWPSQAPTLTRERGSFRSTYEWLGLNAIDVRASHHGIQINGEGRALWVAGAKAPVRTRMDAPLVQVIGGVVEPEQSSGYSDEYTIRSHYYELVTQRLGMDPERDCFATPTNARCGKYFTESQDALRQDWDPAEVLWLNPPLGALAASGGEAVGEHLLGHLPLAGVDETVDQGSGGGGHQTHVP